MSHASDYEYDVEQQCTLPQFHAKFKDKLPLLLIVTEGFYGETKYDDLSNDQIIRLHRPCQQLRALGRLSRDAARLRDEFISIPVDGRYKFAVVKSSKNVGDPQTMEEILAENDLPIQIRYASYNIELKSTMEKIKGLNILVMKTYVEHFMQGNCMEDGVLSPVVTLVALSPEISVSIITGYTNKPKEAFEAKIKSMDLFVEKNITFKDHEGSPEMTMFQRGDATTGTGNPIPPDLLPRDFTHGDDCNLPPPKLIARSHNKQQDDDLYEPLPEPDPKWIPPRPARQNKPQLPPRYEQLQTPHETSNYRVIEADESSEMLSASGGEYMYISDVCESGYNSSKDSWSAGSSKSHVSDKSVSEIQEILKTLNLAKYCDGFKEQLIDGAVLEDLNEEVLRKDFNFMHVEAVRLMKYVRAGHVPK